MLSSCRCCIASSPLTAFCRDRLFRRGRSRASSTSPQDRDGRWKGLIVVPSLGVRGAPLADVTADAGGYAIE